MAWPHGLGPAPTWAPPKSCPPDPDEYDFWRPGSYASRMLWRGFVPLFGGILQNRVESPPTCAEDNQRLNAGMEGALFEVQKELTLDLWAQMNRMLAQLTTIGQAVADLTVLPLRNRLMYLFAAVAALTLLLLALLLSL